MGGPGSGRKPKSVIQPEPVIKDRIYPAPDMFQTLYSEVDTSINGMPALIVSSTANEDGIMYTTYAIAPIPILLERCEDLWVSVYERMPADLPEGYTYHIHKVPGVIVAILKESKPWSLGLIKLVDCRKYQVQIPLISNEEWLTVKPGTEALAVSPAKIANVYPTSTSVNLWSRRFITKEYVVTDYVGYMQHPALVVLMEQPPVLYEITPVATAPEIRRFLAGAGVKI